MSGWRYRLRKAILPLDEIKVAFGELRFASCLDVGAGTGLFLDFLDSTGLIEHGVGVEVDPGYYRQINDRLKIIPYSELGTQRFDIITFIDVLHHVKDKKAFMDEYIGKHLNPGGCVFIKDMDVQNIACLWFNRFHDLVMARELISEIGSAEVKERFKDWRFVSGGQKRIFMYDHYYCLFKQDGDS